MRGRGSSAHTTTVLPRHSARVAAWYSNGNGNISVSFFRTIVGSVAAQASRMASIWIPIGVP